MTYAPPRERDAWFAIRGFVYQVQLTIERWLQLGPDERLELECGEDIDLVAGWAASDEPTERLLEQVKHRDSSLTLNSVEARSALANFVEHVQANPTQKLMFRFVTNAVAGTEKQPALPKRWSGVKIWEELRRGEYEDSAKQRRTAAIRGVLRRGNCPSHTPQDTWHLYRAFIGRAGCQEMDRLIHQFEWSVGHEDTADLRPLLERRIAVYFDGGESSSQKYAYERLFAHVFETLAQPQTKTLTRGDLETLLKDTTSGSTQAVARLTDVTEELKESLARATERLDGHEASISAMQVQITSLARAGGITGEFHAAGPALSLAVPPAPAKTAARPEIVRSVLSTLTSSRWVALIGTSGSGKSEIARQISEAFNGPVHWLSLRDLEENEACACLANAFSNLAEDSSRQVNWLERALRDLSGGMIVLDDLPRFDVSSQLGRVLLSLVRGLGSCGASLITTSPYELSRRVQGLSLATEVPVPPFNEFETRQLLTAFGAPDTASLDAWAQLVAASTAGHAELVVTAAAHLRQQQWNFSAERITELLERTSEAELKSDVLRRVVATTSSEAERELLYRAALISGTFGVDDLRLIAQVDQPVPHPDAALASLEGLWVQPQGGGRFAICPLARQLGEQLPSEVRRGVHSAIGLSYMRRKSLGPIEVLASITHFIRAEEFERAGLSYLLALSSVDRKNIPAFDAGLFSLWSETGLPGGMSLGIKIYIRVLQLGIHDALRKRTDFLVDDLLAVTRSVDDAEVSLLIPVVIHLPLVLQRDFDAGSRIITRIMASLDSLRNPLGEPFDTKLTDGLRRFLWHQTVAATTSRSVRVCLASFRAIPKRILKASASGDAYEMGVVSLCDGVWLSQLRVDDEKRDWNEAWSLLDEIAEMGAELDLSLMTIAARRTQIIVAAEVRKDLQCALQIAESVRHRLQGVEFFLVHECVGRQLVYAGRYVDGIEQLEVALRAEFNSFDSYRFYALLTLAEAYSHSDRGLALEATLNALSLARKAEGFPKLELAKALSEVAIAMYHRSGPRDAFTYVDEAARVLFAIRSESAAWRDVHVLLAHTCGYIQSIASTGNPPPGAASGEAFAEPATGIFIKHHDKRPDLYSKEGETAFRIALAFFANALDQDDVLTFWVSSVQGDEGAPVMRDLAIMFQSVDLIASERLFEAIELSAKVEGADIGVLHLGLALAAKLVGIALEDQERARCVARNVGGYLRSQAKGRVDSERWLLLARVLEVSIDPEFCKEDVLPILKEPASNELIVICGMLMISARQGENPVAVLSAHISVAMFALGQKQIFMPVHRRLLLPAMVGFWKAFVARSRFQLRTPDMVVQDLNKAVEIEPSGRAQVILRTIVRGLGVEVPEVVGTWLASS